MFLLARFSSVRTSPEEDEYAKTLKFVPIGFMIMVLFSFLPCFIAVLDFLGDPADGVGAIFVFIFSLFFTLLWLQGFFLTSGEVSELLKG